MSDPRNSRGYRNRNPGNIDWNERNRWQGQTGIEGPPRNGGRPRFAVFESHEYGIRALAALLTTYQDRHGLRTIRGIVNRWAPPNENQTVNYVRFVADFMKRDPDDQLDLHTYADARPLVEAIIRKELGGNPYDAATIDEGLRRAGVVRPVASVAEAAKTGTGRGAIQGAAATGVVAVAVQAAPALAGLQGLDWRVGVAVVAAAAIGAAVWVMKGRISRGDTV